MFLLFVLFVFRVGAPSLANAADQNLTVTVSCADSRWSLVPDQTSCVIVPNKKLSWSAAETYCQSLSGNLAVIHNSADNAYIWGLVPSPPSSGSTSIWIGANTSTPGKGITGGWKWIDGSAFSYQKWSPGQPDNAVDYCQNTARTSDKNQSCLGIFALTSGGMMWDDGCCSAAQSFVCQKAVTTPAKSLEFSLT